MADTSVQEFKPQSRFSFGNLSTKVKVLLAAGAPLVLTLGIGFVAVTNLEKMSQTSDWVTHTQNVLAQGDKIVASAVDMETGMRGYLLAGEESFLEPYNNGQQSAFNTLGTLRRTVSDNPPQVERLAQAEAVLREWQSEVAEQQIAMRAAIGNSETMIDLAREVQKGEGKVYFDRFRVLIQDFINVERSLLETRNVEFNQLIDLGSASSVSIRDTLGWVNHTHDVIENAQQILAAAVDMETGMRGFLLTGDPEFLAPYNEGRQSFNALTQELSQTVSDNPAQVARLGELRSIISEWNTKVVQPMLDFRRGIVDATTMDDLARSVGEARGKVFFDQFREIMTEFIEIEQALMEERQQENISTARKTENTIIGSVVASMVIGAIVALVIGSNISKAIGTVTSAMRELAGGNTSVEIKGQRRGDEVGVMARSLDIFRKSLLREKKLEEEQKKRDAQQAEVVYELSERLSDLSQGDLTVQIRKSFPEDYEQLRNDFNTTVKTLSNTVTEVIEASGSIQDGANEIGKSSGELSNRTENQAATLEETAAALDELTASVKSAAEGAQNVKQITEEARVEAESSGTVVGNAVSAMAEIEQSSAHISQIINVIDDIAFQTNLLALNAGVEAARAGEAGRGFAVVASEVRALSQRSTDAAKEIKTLISNSSTQVERGVDLVGNAGKALISIIERIGHISNEINNIAEGAAEQSTGLSEINVGVVQLDQVTQRNAAMVEEATAASLALGSDANKLAELVAHFKISGGSNITQLRPTTPAAAPAELSAHGNDDWNIKKAKPVRTSVRMNNSAAEEMWQDF